MRADRLLRLALFLQARGRMTAAQLADELEVSVRTIYRDIEALSAAGVPVWAESGPGGGCELLDGYRMPLTALSPDEAAALLALGVPQPLRELGLGPSVESARQRVRDAGGLPVEPVTVHVDVPRWFGTNEPVPHLPALAEAVRLRRRLNLTYNDKRQRGVAPLGLVNKAGAWYAVVINTASPYVLRAARIESIELLADKFDRPESFDLVAFWNDWCIEFERSRPRIEVLVRASPDALDAMPQVFGARIVPVIASAAADQAGWRTIPLTFEHEAAAVARLAGFADEIQVLSPDSLRERLVATARAIIAKYATTDGKASTSQTAIAERRGCGVRAR